MFKIYGGATEFKQWDQNKMVVNPNMTDCEEVVFRMSNGKAGVSLAYEYEGEMVADVPNHLLKYSGNMMVELGQNEKLRIEERTYFNVTAAEQEKGYVYTDNRKLGKKNIVTTKQNLTEAEKEQARENIGIGCGFGTEYGTIEVLGEMTTTGVATAFSAPLGMIAGNTYTVMWNSVKYDCLAQAFDMEGISAVTLGDSGLFAGESITGEPFAVMEVPAEYAEAMGGYGTVLSADHSEGNVISIHTEGEIVKQIDPKYIPGGSGGGNFTVTMITNGFDESTEEFIVESVDKTYEEIVEAASKGLVHEIKIDSSKDWGELKFFYAPLAKIDSNEVEFGRYYQGEETKVFIRADGTYEYLCIER